MIILNPTKYTVKEEEEDDEIEEMKESSLEQARQSCLNDSNHKKLS